MTNEKGEAVGEVLTIIQGASGIDARFLKLSPASTVRAIMTKFSQYSIPLTPPAT